MLDDIAAAGSCDFVTDIAVPIPLVVIAELMGLPSRTATSSASGRTG